MTLRTKLFGTRAKEKEDRGEHFPKKYPMYYPIKIIEQKDEYRLGTLTTVDTNKKFYVVEDTRTISRYKTLAKAREHYEDNLRIDKEMREDFKRDSKK